MRAQIILSILVFSLLRPALNFSQETIIRGGWTFDSAKGEFFANTGIVIRGGKFMKVGAGLTDQDLSGAEVVELSDNDYILPGLFDLHAHYNVNLFGTRRRDETTVMPVVFLANGVTSTFPAGEYDPEEMLALRKAINRGEQIGPRLFNSGPYFGPARIGWNPEITTQEIFHEVDYWAEQGVSGFKAKRISPQHLQALIERAHWHGLTVTGHLDSGFRNTINPRDAILMGIDRIEHFLGGDAISPDKPAYSTLVDFKPGTPEFERIVKLYLNYNVYFDATLTAYGYFGERKEGYDYWTDEQRFLTPFMREQIAKKSARRFIEQFEKIYWVKRKTVKAFYDAGGGRLITLGTDHSSTGEYLAGFSIHRELEAFVLSGIPAAAAIQFATTNAAKALNMDEKLGSIEPGKFADLCVVKGNPLEDIKNTRNVFLVMKAGKIYHSVELLKSVEGKLGPSNAEEVEEW
ncbi:MAG: amidohydrolase family protein [bacterium]